MTRRTTGVATKRAGMSAGGHVTISDRDVITPSGNPDAMPLAIVTIRCDARVLDREHLARAPPDWTSSTMRSMPNLAVISRRRS